jgi:hypothetical protein
VKEREKVFTVFTIQLERGGWHSPAFMSNSEWLTPFFIWFYLYLPFYFIFFLSFLNFYGLGQDICHNKHCERYKAGSFFFWRPFKKSRLDGISPISLSLVSFMALVYAGVYSFTYKYSKYLYLYTKHTAYIECTRRTENIQRDAVNRQAHTAGPFQWTSDLDFYIFRHKKELDDNKLYNNTQQPFRHWPDISLVRMLSRLQSVCRGYT